MMFSRCVSTSFNHKSNSLSFFANRKYSSVENGSVSKLSNGVNVAAENINGETATIGVFVKTGSSFETESNNGISNLFQRLAFKGTKSKNQQQIALDVENLGGSLKSYTNRDHSVFLAKVFKKDVPHAVELLSDVIQNSQFSAESIEREKKIILEEIDRTKSPKETAFDFLHSIAFQGSPYGFLVQGTKDSVKNISQSDLSAYASSQFTGNRVSVVGVGALPDNFSSLVESNFHTLKSEAFKEQAPKFFGSLVTVLDDTHHEIDAIVAFKGASYDSPDYIPLLIIREIVGDYHKLQLEGNRGVTKLNELVATEHLADSFNTFNLSYRTTGLFGIHYKVDTHHGDPDALSNFILTEFVRLGNGTTDKEVAMAKNKLKASLLSYEGTTRICEEIGTQINNAGRRISNAELFARIDLVDTATIHEVAARYLTHVEPVAVATGDIYNFPDYNQLCSWTYWNRL